MNKLTVRFMIIVVEFIIEFIRQNPHYNLHKQPQYELIDDLKLELEAE